MRNEKLLVFFYPLNHFIFTCHSSILKLEETVDY